MYQSILIPIDMSAIERAPDMFAAAKALQSDGGIVTCLHVVPEIPAIVSMEIPTDVMPRLMSSARESIQAEADKAGVKATIEIEAGHPAQAILETAASISADLIIVGSHQPGLEDYLLGSTASRVVRHAKCATLVQR